MNDKLNEILIDLFELEPGQIADTLTADDVELWDSLNHLKLVTAVEETFGVQLSMAEIETIDSIGRLREMLAQHA